MEPSRPAAGCTIKDRVPARCIRVTLLIAAAVLSPAAQKPSGTQIVLLGTGTPAIEPDRSAASTAIVVNGAAYLIDFGPGVIRRAKAAQLKGIDALDPVKIQTAFVTHLHSDHTAGYPDLIFTPWVMGRKEPLTVYGPKGIRAMTGHVLEAWQEDVSVRNNGLEHNFPHHVPGAYKVNAHEIEPGVVFRDGNITVKAFRVPHGEWENAFGYRFETPGRTIVIAGDTGPSASVVENCNGCDVLIHEVYTLASFRKSTPQWQAYAVKYHTSTKELAELASKARPGLLILHHQMYGRNGLSTEKDLEREMRELYHGRFVSGHDLDVY